MVKGNNEALGATDVRRLRELYEKNAAARALLDELAGRERNWRETSVDRLVAIFETKGDPLPRKEVIAVLKELEKIGSGSFLIGRRGKRSRFVWTDDLMSVGQAARGEADETEAAAGEDEGAIAQLVTHYYQLRPDLQIRLELPEELTDKEAQRLGDFIKTLPFGAA
jgi:hypothetical protein